MKFIGGKRLETKLHTEATGAFSYQSCTYSTYVLRGPGTSAVLKFSIIIAILAVKDSTPPYTDHLMPEPKMVHKFITLKKITLLSSPKITNRNSYDNDCLLTFKVD